MGLRTLSVFIVFCVFVSAGNAEETFAVGDDLQIFPNVSEIVFDVLEGSRYNIVICYSCSNESQVAWYHSNGTIVQNDTSAPYYQIYAIGTGEPYPASLAVSNNESLAERYLTCREMSKNICGSYNPIVYVVSSDLKPPDSNITLRTRTTSNSTDILCYSLENINVSWWHFEGAEITTDSSYPLYQKYLTMPTGYQAAQLDAKFATESDSGCYTCKEIYNEDEGTTCLELPEFRTIRLGINPAQEKFTLNKDKDDYLKISCILADVKPLPLTWNKNGVDVSSDEKSPVSQDISYKRSVLNITKDAGFSESGIYECVAANEKGEESRAVTIEILGQYSLNLDPDVSILNIIAGEYPEHDVIIMCYSEDDVSLTWYKENKPISADDTLPIYQREGPDLNSTLLVILEAKSWTAEDIIRDGEYICKRTNYDGYAEKIVQVNVYESGFTDIEIDGVSNSATTIFTCSASSNSLASLFWCNQDGVKITDDTTAKVFQLSAGTEDSESSNLILKHDDSVEKGYYTCIVSGTSTYRARSGSIVANSESINYQGYFVINLSENANFVKIDRDAGPTEIQCSSSDVSQQISWYKEQKEIEQDSILPIHQTYPDSGKKSLSVLYISSSSSEIETGVYSCRAIVADGIESRDIFVDIDPEVHVDSTVGLIIAVSLLSALCAVFLALLVWYNWLDDHNRSKVKSAITCTKNNSVGNSEDSGSSSPRRTPSALQPGLERTSSYGQDDSD